MHYQVCIIITPCLHSTSLKVLKLRWKSTLWELRPWWKKNGLMEIESMTNLISTNANPILPGSSWIFIRRCCSPNFFWGRLIRYCSWVHGGIRTSPSTQNGVYWVWCSPVCDIFQIWVLSLKLCETSRDLHIWWPVKAMEMQQTSQGAMPFHQSRKRRVSAPFDLLSTSSCELLKLETLHPKSLGILHDISPILL